MIDSSNETENGVTEAKQKFWQDHVKAWKQSGIRQTEYCSHQGLNIKIFGYWKRKLVSKSEDVSFVPVSIKPLHTASVKSVSSLKIVTCNGLSIEVSDGFNPATLRMLLDTIAQRV